MIRVLAFSCLLTFAAALPASAQKKPPSPAGVWTFETAADRGCRLSGEMTVAQSKSPRFACSFTVVQACTEREPHAIHTEQTCTLTQTGQEIAITSKLTRVTSVDPASMLKFEMEGYLPDDFKLTINTRGDMMTGAYSSHRTAPALFKRKQELVS